MPSTVFRKEAKARKYDNVVNNSVNFELLTRCREIDKVILTTFSQENRGKLKSV